MPMRFLFAVLFGLAGTALLVWLGVWQLQRLEWKRGVLDDIQSKISAPPVALPQNPDATNALYLPVTATGKVGDEEIHVLVSRKHVGAGYRIITVLTLPEGRRVLLDRGFITTDQKIAERSIGAAEVSGNLHWPQETGGSIPQPDIAANIWFARDVPAMAAHLKTEPTLIVAKRPVFENDPVTPLPVDTTGIPNDHLQYAITWFALAAIWLVMTLAFLWREQTAQKETA